MEEKKTKKFLIYWVEVIGWGVYTKHLSKVIHLPIYSDGLPKIKDAANQLRIKEEQIKAISPISNVKEYIPNEPVQTGTNIKKKKL